MKEKAYTVNGLLTHLRKLEEADADFVKVITKYADFVNQPFKPSLLLLFEGIKKINVVAPNYKFQVQYAKSVDKSPFDDISIQDKFKFVNEDSSSLIYEVTRGGATRNLYSSATLSFPRTLHDFISDCDRMGILLEFKEGALPAEINWLLGCLKF